MLLGALPKTFQDGATKLLHNHLKNSSNTSVVSASVMIGASDRDLSSSLSVAGGHLECGGCVSSYHGPSAWMNLVLIYDLWGLVVNFFYWVIWSVSHWVTYFLLTVKMQMSNCVYQADISHSASGMPVWQLSFLDVHALKIDLRILGKKTTDCANCPFTSMWVQRPRGKWTCVLSSSPDADALLPPPRALRATPLAGLPPDTPAAGPAPWPHPPTVPMGACLQGNAISAQLEIAKAPQCLACSRCSHQAGYQKECGSQETTGSHPNLNCRSGQNGSLLWWNEQFLLNVLWDSSNSNHFLML